MDNKNLMPQQAQPVNRLTTGQLPSELAELSEEALSRVQGWDDSSSVLPSWGDRGTCSPNDWGLAACSYDGEDGE
ncbi:DUF5837 family protein [Kamptonema animale CS-326]|jgi:bacteriocin leader peptide (microcyclamide/patellamide family)|uniref:DUF5837 family cyanobactin class RiPP n=1 Tax=Kamptonema animale TaxID=92934 RepID=UPI002330AA1C|nr:DUF5837 family cyanobactin class RiPP [Kamptonema animale]MDB9513176.1 DUF5837 family protein [Kamptonema animale CS-326]